MKSIAQKEKKTMYTKEELDKIARYHVSKDKGGFIHGWPKVSRRLMDERFKVIDKYSISGAVLEIGFADGNITENLSKSNKFTRIVVVDGSQYYCERIKKIIKDKRLEVVNALYEDYLPDEKFDTIVLSHIIEHVEDPKHLLQWSNRLISDNGAIIILTNSNKGLHRYMGAKLGILEAPESFTEYDKKLGHKTMFNYQSLKQAVVDSGLKVKYSGGFYLKMLSNVQVEEQWSDEMIEASISLGYDFPEIAAEIFVIGERI